MSFTTGQRSTARRLGALALLIVATATTAGCATRAAPFDQMDKAQVTILRLQPAAAAQPMPTQPGAGTLIPGLPPELQNLANATLQQLQQQGIIPPGLIPGMPGQTTQPMQPQLPPYPNDPQWAIADQRPVVDDALKEQLLDLFGNADSFNDQRQNCWTPGMAVSFQSPTAQPVDVLVSFSCNQAVGYGFQWPHPQSGLTMESRNTLTGIYQSLFGPVPPQG